MHTFIFFFRVFFLSAAHTFRPCELRVLRIRLPSAILPHSIAEASHLSFICDEPFSWGDVLFARNLPLTGLVQLGHLPAEKKKQSGGRSGPSIKSSLWSARLAEASVRPASLRCLMPSLCFCGLLCSALL
eukprot:RCo006892